MRKITSESINAFLSGTLYRRGNTSVVGKGIAIELRLHGNMIAYMLLGSNTFYIQNNGWFTNTTKERLNALLNVSIQQKKGEWFLNGEKWDGHSTPILLEGVPE